MSSASDELRGYLDAEGRVRAWPARKNRAKQLAILAYVAAFFEAGRDYTEREVNEIIKAHITFSDFVLVRRELYEAKLLDRTIDGRRYWRA